MQSIYAMHQNGSDSIEKQEKFLLYSADNILDLYLVMLSSLIEIGKKEAIFIEKSGQKHITTSQERNPNKKFINNTILQILSENNSLSIALENRKINHWELMFDLDNAIECNCDLGEGLAIGCDSVAWVDINQDTIFLE